MLLKNTDFIDLPIFAKGKVRDVYEVGDDMLLMIVADRISAFDVVFEELIPDKGRILNKISEFWFDYSKDIIGNHVVTSNVSEYPMGLDKYHEQLNGRSMLVKRLRWKMQNALLEGI